GVPTVRDAVCLEGREAAPAARVVTMEPSGHHAGDRRTATCAILTVSDTRTPETDTSGARIRALLDAAGHKVTAYSILPDEPDLVRERVVQLIATGVEAVIVNGGTGLAPRDTTYEAVAGLLDKRLDGFGELFRSLSYAEIGAAAMLSRAVPAVSGRTGGAALPGVRGAVRPAVSRRALT